VNDALRTNAGRRSKERRSWNGGMAAEYCATGEGGLDTVGGRGREICERPPLARLVNLKEKTVNLS